MKTPLLKIILVCFISLFTFTSCTEDDDVTPRPSTGANSVSGMVVDTKGKPMAGVKVRAENPSGNNIHVDGTTGADGKYNLKLSSIGGWKIYAWKSVEYKDKVYHLRLGMPNDNDYDSFTPGEEGVVKNFVMKLSGRIPDRSVDIKNGFGYFGGSLRFVNVNGIYPQMVSGTKVTVTLTPTTGAKYLDGTSATGLIQKSFTINNSVDQNYYLGDIPVTEYRVNIESELNGNRKQVKVGSHHSTLYEWLEFDFDPATLSSGSYENGLKSPSDDPFYLGQVN